MSRDAGKTWANVGLKETRSIGRIVVDPTNENVVYTASTVMWRSEDGGITWTAVRGAPGGDDYQRVWVNPNDTNIILAVSDQGAVISANHGMTWSNWYTQPTAAMYHVSTDNAFPYRVCGGQQDSGSGCVDSAAGNRTPVRRASTVAPWTARSRSTIGIR